MRYAITLKPCPKCSHTTGVIRVDPNGTPIAKCFGCGTRIPLRKERQ